MNERFNRLADEAGFVRFSTEEDENRPIDWSSDYSVELERFGQLIVKQCAHLLETRDGRHEPAPHIYLLKAFGVKI